MVVEANGPSGSTLLTKVAHGGNPRRESGISWGFPSISSRKDRTFALFSSRGTLSAVVPWGNHQDHTASPPKVSHRSPLHNRMFFI